MKKYLVLLALVYLALPVAAGFFKVGDQDGPRIYHESHHSLLYTFGYELANDNKEPNASVFWLLTNRPWFYGMDRQQKPADEQLKIILDLQKEGKEIDLIKQELENLVKG